MDKEGSLKDINGNDPWIFETNIRKLLAWVSDEIRQNIFERSGEFNSVIVNFDYKRLCGHDVGSLDNPKTTDDVPVKRLKDGSVDWSDPNIFSPTKLEHPDTDYEKLFNVIVDVLCKTVNLRDIQEKNIKLIGDRSWYKKLSLEIMKDIERKRGGFDDGHVHIWDYLGDPIHWDIGDLMVCTVCGQVWSLKIPPFSMEKYRKYEGLTVLETYEKRKSSFKLKKNED